MSEGISFVFRFYEDDVEYGQGVLKVVDEGTNRIIQFNVMDDFVKNYRNDFVEEFSIVNPATKMEITTNEDLVTLVKEAVTNQLTEIPIDVISSRSDWEMIDAASQNTNTNATTLSKDIEKVISSGGEVQGASAKAQVQENEKSKEVVTDLCESTQSDFGTLTSEDASCVSESKDEGCAELKQANSDTPKAEVVAEDEDELPGQQSASVVVEHEAQQQQEETKVEKLQGEYLQDGSVVKGAPPMATRSQDIVHKMETLSVDCSRQLTKVTSNVDKSDEGALSKQVEAIPEVSQIESGPMAGDGCFADSEGSFKLLPENFLVLEDWSRSSFGLSKACSSKGDAEAAATSGIQNPENDKDTASLKDTLQDLLDLGVGPEKRKLEELVPLLAAVTDEILKSEKLNDFCLPDFFTYCDRSFLNTLNSVLSEENVVESVQRALASTAVRDLAVDLGRNEVSTVKGFRSIFAAHLGDLFSVFGQLLRDAPQLLTLLPHGLKHLSSFLETEKSEGEAPREVPGNSTTVVHSGIVCDGCDNGDAKVQAETFGHIKDGYICGIRYKSAVKVNFDLCESCEASGAFEESHGPFLKIRTPKQAPKEIVCVLQDGSTMGKVHYESAGFQQTLETPTESPKPGIVCPRKRHPLNSFTVPNRLFACNACDSRPQRGSIMYGCRLCDFDLCQSCVDARLTAAQPTLPKPPQPCVSPKMRLASKPRGKFIADVNFLDGSVLEPGTKFTKIWRVKNSSSTIPWESGCRIVCVGGDMLGANVQGQLVPPLPPNQVGDVCVQMVAPKAPGRYLGYWRLVTPNNERFGQRFWIDITVKETQGKVHQARSQPLRDIDVERWSKELEQLADMEFLNCEANVQLLERLGGDVERVVEALLEGQRD